MAKLSSKELDYFLKIQHDKPTLRFITCGSVDDGKSTLIGRLLFDSNAVFDDQLASLEKESVQYGTQGEKLDLALILDGLQAEREQGITIDVAYRFFATSKQRYIVADTPGHEQYTRNMATGASTADVAVILIDSRKGLLTQTRRHSRIVAMMGIRSILLAVNKMDLINFDQEVFDSIAGEYQLFAKGLGFDSVTATPVSALHGDNVLHRSRKMPWYLGPSLIDYLDSINPRVKQISQPFCMPVQWVNRPNLDFRGLCGTIEAGSISSGDKVVVLPSGIQTKINKVIYGFEEVRQAIDGMAVTLTLVDEVDASRGDVLVAVDEPAKIADQFEATMLWMSEKPMVLQRNYAFKLATKEISATITDIKYRVDVNSGEHLKVNSLHLNEISCVNIITSAPLVFEPYSSNRVLGSFILIDQLTFETVGAGMLNFSFKGTKNIQWQKLSVNKNIRAAQKLQKPKCIWFTGLSGAGKSTIANLLEQRLQSEGKHTYLLDGDNVRHGLNSDLGFTESDRVENLRRVAEVARMLVDAGLIVLVSFISPFKSERTWARSLFEVDEFIEVFVDASMAECEKRDIKGLYAKARRGEIVNFTGIDSPYEKPESPDVHLLTGQSSAESCLESLLKNSNLNL